MIVKKFVIVCGILLFVFSQLPMSGKAAKSVLAEKYMTNPKYIIYGKGIEYQYGKYIYHTKQVSEHNALYYFHYDKELKRYPIEFHARTLQMVSKKGFFENTIYNSYGQYYDVEDYILPYRLKKFEYFTATTIDASNKVFKEKNVIEYINGKIKIGSKTYTDIVKVTSVNTKTPSKKWYAPGIGIIKFEYYNGALKQSEWQMTKVVKKK